MISALEIVRSGPDRRRATRSEQSAAGRTCGIAAAVLVDRWTGDGPASTFSYRIDRKTSGQPRLLLRTDSGRFFKSASAVSISHVLPAAAAAVSRP